MDPVPFTPQPPAASGAPVTTPPLERELKSQQFLLQVVMVVLVVVLTTTTLGLFHQIRWLLAQANQLNATAQELGRFVGEYETNLAPQMSRMFTDLRRFAESNPEFGRTFAKYRIVGETPGATNPAVPPKGR
jgi:hypothetical protein